VNLGHGVVEKAWKERGKREKAQEVQCSSTFKCKAGDENTCEQSGQEVMIWGTSVQFSFLIVYLFIDIEFYKWAH